MHPDDNLRLLAEGFLLEISAKMRSPFSIFPDPASTMANKEINRCTLMTALSLPLGVFLWDVRSLF